MSKASSLGQSGARQSPYQIFFRNNLQTVCEVTTMHLSMEIDNSEISALRKDIYNDFLKATYMYTGQLTMHLHGVGFKKSQQSRIKWNPFYIDDCQIKCRGNKLKILHKSLTKITVTKMILIRDPTTKIQLDVKNEYDKIITKSES